MSRARYAPKFKAEAVKQVTEPGHGVIEVANRLGISDKSLYLWAKQAKDQDSVRAAAEAASLRREVGILKAKLKRTAEERDILMKAAAYLARQSS